MQNISQPLKCIGIIIPIARHKLVFQPCCRHCCRQNDLWVYRHCEVLRKLVQWNYFMINVDNVLSMLLPLYLEENQACSQSSQVVVF